MADELMLEIVTPEKMAFSGKIEEVTIPGSEGEFGVLRGHASLLSSLDAGVLNYTQDNKKTFYAVSMGYAEVTSSKVIVLVESAERSDMIDRERAQKAKEKAESNLSKMTKEDIEFEKEKAALARAIARLAAIDRHSAS